MRGSDIRGHAGFVGDVALEERGLVGAEFGDRSRAFFLVDVEQGDLAAMGDQVLGHGEAEAGNATSDDGADGCGLHGGILWAERRDFSGSKDYPSPCLAALGFPSPREAGRGCRRRVRG